MPSPAVALLTKQALQATARNFQWNRQMPKWTVVIEGRELPARPLVLEAAGVPPNDPTNSHQAVAVLTQQGFEVRYQGKQIEPKPRFEAQPVTDEYIRSMRGSCKEKDSLVEALQHERRSEK